MFAVSACYCIQWGIILIFFFNIPICYWKKQNEKYNHGQINFVKSIRQFIILFKVFTPISINLKPSDKKDETIKWG